MAVYKRGRVWWYRFIWRGEAIRESTKQTNKRVAEQIEAAHKTSLAKGEVGLRDRMKAPTLQDFVDQQFRPFIESRCVSKPKTLEYYNCGMKHLSAYARIANSRLDQITAQDIAAFIASRRDAKYAVTSINRQLEVLRRIFKLAAEWGAVEKILPRVQMLGGERRRERVLTIEEENRYLSAAEQVGNEILEAYGCALEGIRAQLRGEQPIKPEDPFLLRDVTTLLVDCGLRPEECFRLEWDFVRDGALYIPFGKTASARRRIPLSARVAELLEIRKSARRSSWVFPAPTQTGHIEKSSLKKQHAKALMMANVAAFPLYTFRHTCITRWAAHMDPYTLGYLAGHSDFSTTRRYVHPQTHTVVEAMERVRVARAAQSGHKNGHSGDSGSFGQVA
ncbi:MAG TPA: tyrosine-type recombinase/integrase [Bryobacteraceae bacterium]|jgi:integrase|nr:tyrosine-type recombinase/integrase [Bryobacteraceae bacterium]